MKPTRVITLKADLKDQLDKFLIVSSNDASLILGINEGKISSIGDSKFAVNETTIHASTMHDGSFVQVTPTRVIRIRDHIDKKAKNSEWNCDSGRFIYSACSNSRQVVIQVQKDQLIYFEMDDSQGGQLMDKGQHIFK